MANGLVYFGATKKQIEAVESWKPDHDEAMECYRLEEWLSVMCFVFSMIENTNDRLRRLVFLGKVPPSDPIVDEVYGLYTFWLNKTEEALNKLERMEESFDEIAGAAEFKEKVALARERVVKHVPQEPSLSLSRLEWMPNQEEQAEISMLLKSEVKAKNRTELKYKVEPSLDVSFFND